MNKILLFSFGIAFCKSFFLCKSIKKSSAKRSQLDILSNSGSNSSELLSQLSIFSKSIPIYQSIDKDLYVSKGYQRVTGCLSEVWVKCELVGDNNKFIFLGTSDSLLIRGVLGVLSSRLSSASPEEIMHINFENISSILPFYNNNIMSPGRLNGVQNILTAIKEQVSIISKNNNPINSIIVIPDESFTDIEEEGEEHEKGQGKLILNDKTFTKFESSSQNTLSPSYKEEVAMLLSGGVDSSVALKLLVDQGYTVDIILTKRYYIYIYIYIVYYCI
jgi:sulfur transfer protein SufE